MSIYDKLNEPQREAVYHTDGPLLILAGADAQDRISDRRAECESVEYPGDHVYEQGSRRDERKGGFPGGLWLGKHLGKHFSFDVCADFKKIYRPAWV